MKKNRQRENDEYEYKKNLERKKEQDKHEEDVRQRDKKNREQQESLEKTLLERDREMEKKVAELKIKALEETIAQQQAQITLLQSRLEDATRQVQDIAVKAIEGASGSKALGHINQIAMEQAKNRASSI